MPYYIYRITPAGPLRRLDKLAEHEAFKEASAEAKRLRREAAEPGVQVRAIFAANELEAEDLLNQPPREDPAAGEEY